MTTLNPDSYITIQSWMVTDLQLKGNELLVYAIVFGFSQDGCSKFTGSLQYLANWTNSTKQGVQKNLKSLVEKGLLLKDDYEIQGVHHCRYYAVVDGMQQSCTPVKQSCTNNINNNIVKKVLSKDNTDDPSKFLVHTSTTVGKPNLYTKCINYVHECYPSYSEVSKLLDSYLRMLLENKDKPVYFNQWKSLVDKLVDLEKSGNDACKVVSYSLEHGYRGFYDLLNNTYKPSNPDTNKSTQNKMTRTEIESNMARNEDGTPRVF